MSKIRRVTICRRWEDLLTTGEHSDLEELEIQCDNGQSAPGLEKLTALKKLTLRDCRQLPRDIGRLDALLELHLFAVGTFVCLPDWIGDLRQLTKLSVMDCSQLQSLPITIGKLTNLSELHLSHCRFLQKLPDELANMSRLELLSISDCKELRGLPSTIGSLQSLTSLHIEDCPHFVQFPRGLDRLVKLDSMKIRRCGADFFENATGAQLPPRLRKLRLGKGVFDCFYEIEPKEVSAFLTSNCYLSVLDFDGIYDLRSRMRLDEMLTVNKFRPVLPGGHLLVHPTHFPTLLSIVNTKLHGRRACIATVIYFWVLRWYVVEPTARPRKKLRHASSAISLSATVDVD